MSRIDQSVQASARAGWDWRALFRPRQFALGALALIVVATGLGVSHSERASLDPLGSLLHVMGRGAGADLALTADSRAEWLPSGRGGRLILHLRALGAGESGPLNIRIVNSNAVVPEAATASHDTTAEIALDAAPNIVSGAVSVSLTDAGGHSTTVRLPVQTVAGTPAP